MKYYLLLLSCVISLTAMESEKNDLPRKLTPEEEEFWDDIYHYNEKKVIEYLSKNPHAPLQCFNLKEKVITPLSFLLFWHSNINERMVELMCCQPHMKITDKEWLNFFERTTNNTVNSF